MTPDFRLRPATEADFEPLLDLSIRVMRDDLERIGRFDPARRRARMQAAFAGGGMQVVEAEGRVLGCLGVEAGDRAGVPAGADPVQLHSLYLEPCCQGRGLGSAIMARLLALHPSRTFRLEVLKHSAARRFWEKQGFAVVAEQLYDWVLERAAS